MDNILEVRNLQKDFKDFSLKDVSFSLKKGYIMGFIGPNGAGKSTTIKLILNLLKKDAGTISVFGLDNIESENTVKNRIGFVHSENYYYEELTIDEMKRVIAPFYTDWDESLFKKFIKEFQLPVKSQIKTLSNGMKMKFSLAIALSHQAQLLIMDEPTSGLDPMARTELLEILSEIMQDENKAVFFSTHITSDLDKIADYITFINNGKIILSATKDEIIDNYGIVKGSKELLTEDFKTQFIAIKENKFAFEGLIDSRDKAKKWANDNIIIEKPNLEEIMLYFIRRDRNV